MKYNANKNQKQTQQRTGEDEDGGDECCCGPCKCTHVCCGPCRYPCTKWVRRIAWTCSISTCIEIPSAVTIWAIIKSLNAGSGGGSTSPSPALVLDSLAGVDGAESATAWFGATAPTAGASAYSWVDSLQLSVASMGATPTSGSMVWKADWGSPFAATLKGSNTTQITEKVSIPAATYNSAELAIWSKWTLKAFCKTQNNLVYTSSTGVKAVPLSGLSQLPSDYGAFLFDHMPGASSAASTSNTSIMATQLKHQIALTAHPLSNLDVQSSTHINMLVDTSYSVLCYDGTASGTSDLVSPLGSAITYGMGSGAASQTFDLTAPTFVFTGATMPVFVSTEDIWGETYTFSTSAANLPTQANFDWSKVSVMTMAWNSTDAHAGLLGVSTRGGDLGGYHLPVQGFARTSDYTTIKSVSITPPSSSSASTYYYIKVKRQS